MSTNKHVKLTRPIWDQAYYDDLAKIISNVTKSLLKRNNLSADTFRILDVGCGTGEIMKSLSILGLKPIGVDLQFACALRSKNFGPVAVGDLMTLNSIFPEEHFDLIICSHVLEHLENGKAALDVMKRLSSKRIIIVVPNLSRLANFFVRSPRYINKGHLHGWDWHHLKTFLEIHCHLKIIRWVRDAVTLSPLRRTFLLNSKLLHLVEYKVLPALIPQVANSLIVLCEKR